MTIYKVCVITFMAGVITFLGFEIGEKLTVPGAQGLVPAVEARVGRPLTPVSVAGVARRTVRRCAVGVYNCSLPSPESLEIQARLTWFESILPKKHQTVSYVRLQRENLSRKG
jgi:hypothetical protein